MMRIIAGRYRSRRLEAPRGMDTRPTSDRLRETLFNVLSPRIEGARFLDLYAGSGAVGIEALSRGAVSVDFVESAAVAVAAIRANLNALKVETANYRIHAARASAALQRMKDRAHFDLVFLDPPYDASAEYASTLNFLGDGRNDLCSANVLVIAEHRKQDRLEDAYGQLQRSRTLAQGDVVLSFFEFANQQEDR